MSGWSGHFHGFGPWIGSPSTYHKEGNRRPPHPDPPAPGASHEQRYKEAAAEFAASSLPPMMTGHWLMKRGQASRERTWVDAAEAVEWLTKHYEENPPFEREDGKQAYGPLDSQQESALRRLPAGGDVSWVHYLRSGNIVSIAVVCCPNRLHPELSCPLGIKE